MYPDGTLSWKTTLHNLSDLWLNAFSVDFFIKNKKKWITNGFDRLFELENVAIWVCIHIDQAVLPKYNVVHA